MNIIKLVAKCGLLVQHRKLTLQDAEPAKQPVYDASSTMLELLQLEGAPHTELAALSWRVTTSCCPPSSAS